MKASVKEEVKEVKEVKEGTSEFNLEEAFVLWKNTSKNGKDFLRGHDLHNNKLVGFFNTKKKNPKEPDVRVCEVNFDSEGKENTGKEVCALWEYTSKTDTRYLTGSTDENEEIVAFYGKENQEARPYIRAYFKETDK